MGGGVLVGGRLRVVWVAADWGTEANANRVGNVISALLHPLKTNNIVPRRT